MLSTRTHARVGFVVPKYGHSSVDRNRLKRRLRELVRTQLLPSLRPAVHSDDLHAIHAADTRAAVQRDAAGAGVPPVDVVVRALPAAYDAPFSALAAEVGRVYEGVRERVTQAGR
jgi:RNase P protein component